MIVVADTSPVNYLVLIDEIHLLPAMFGTVILPLAVLHELQDPQTSQKVRDWVAAPPVWLEFREASLREDKNLIRLDPGEREAIQLALDLRVGTVLIDEALGRRAALALHLEVRGNFREALDKLEQTNFRLSPAVRAAFLERNP